MNAKAEKETRRTILHDAFGELVQGHDDALRVHQRALLNQTHQINAMDAHNKTQDDRLTAFEMEMHDQFAAVDQRLREWRDAGFVARLSWLLRGA